MKIKRDKFGKLSTACSGKDITGSQIFAYLDVRAAKFGDFDEMDGELQFKSNDKVYKAFMSCRKKQDGSTVPVLVVMNETESVKPDFSVKLDDLPF